MKKHFAIFSLYICALIPSALTVHANEDATKAFIYNPFASEWSGVINIDLHKMDKDTSGLASAVVRSQDGKILPSQTDDLDFDGKIDEVAVRLSVKPNQAIILDLEFTKDKEKGMPFATSTKGIGLKNANFEMAIGDDGLINSITLTDEPKAQVAGASNLYVWRIDNAGWEQKSANVSVKRKIGSLRAIYDIKGMMHAVNGARGEMQLHRQMKIYPDSKVENSIRIDYLSGGVFFTGNTEGGIRSNIECNPTQFYRTLSWDFGNTLKTADMRKAWSHMRRVAGGIVGGFMDPKNGCGIISMPARRDSSLRLWDNRTTTIPEIPRNRLLIVNGLGWWGKNVNPGESFESGWQTFAFYNQGQAAENAKLMIETPLVFYSESELKNEAANITGAGEYAEVSELFKNAPQPTHNNESGQLSEKRLNQYLNSVNSDGKALWAYLDAQSTQMAEPNDTDAKQAISPVITESRKYSVYRKVMKLSRATSAWERFAKLKKRAMSCILMAQRYKNEIEEKHIGRLVTPHKSDMGIGFFGGDPSPKCEEIWTEFSTMVGLKYMHPIYFVKPLKHKDPHDWGKLFRLHEKYGSKFVICIHTDRIGKRETGLMKDLKKDKRFADWFALTHNGQPVKGWYGSLISVVDPELYGSLPEWMQLVKQRLEANVSSYIELCKRKNIALDEAIIGFAVENEPVFAYDYNPHVIKAYHNWLKKRFSDINEFNSKFKTNYKNFAKVFPPSFQQRFSHAGEWMCFNLFRLDNQAGYIKWQADIIKQICPQLTVITKPNCSYGTNASVMRGNDSWMMGKSESSKTGINCYCRHTAFTTRLPHLDMVRSGGNGQPLWMTEFGLSPFRGLPGSKIISPLQSREIIYALALHGIEKTFLYQLGSARRNPTSHLRGDCFPTDSMLSLAERQIEFDQLGSLNNFQPERKVAIYYSRLSTIMGTPDPAPDTEAVHNMLRHLNYNVDYIDLQQILHGNLNKYKMLYIQRSPYLDNRLADLLDDFAKQGGIVVMEGGSGLYDAQAEKYNSLPADMGNMFGATLTQNAEPAPLSFDEDTINANTGNLTFKLKEPEYKLDARAASVVMRDQESGQPLACVNRRGKGCSILLSFPLGEEYTKTLKRSSVVKGNTESFFDKVGGLSYGKEKIYEEPVHTPPPGEWLAKTLNHLGLSPSVSRAEKDIEAARFVDKSGKSFLILINHRNKEITSRLTVSNKLSGNVFYDLFTLHEFVARKNGSGYTLRAKMDPYQVRILACEDK